MTEKSTDSAALDLLEEADRLWGKEFGDPGNAVSGGDLVEWFAEWLPRAQIQLRKARH